MDSPKIDVDSTLPVKRKRGGQPGNGERQKLTRNYTRVFLADFKKHGIETVRRVREKDPVAYIREIGRMMPREHRLQLHSDYHEVLQEAMAQLQRAGVDANGQKQLAHLAANTLESAIIEGELVEQEEK